MNDFLAQSTGAGSGPVGSMPDGTRPTMSPHPFEFTHEHITQAAYEGVVTVDVDQRIVMINPAAQRMFGCAAAEVLGGSLSRFIPLRYRMAHAKHLRQYDQSGTVERPMAERRRVVGLRANGQEFPAEIVISRLDVLGPFGPRRYFTALLRDLSEVRDLKAEIETLNQRLHMVFDLAPIAIWIIEREQIVFANHACAALFGAASQQDLVGRPIYELLSAPSQRAVGEAVQKALTTKQPIAAVSERITLLDGTMCEVEIAMAALPDHGQTALQMVITDSTRRNRESRDLERSRRELRQLSASLVDAREEERRRIAREMHDELGQRLTALQMELSSLAHSWPEGSDKRRVDAMLGMVEETVASVRRIATELRPLMLDDLGLNAAIEWLAKSWADRMDIGLLLDLGEQDPPIGAAGSIALYRMVQEALTNIARHAQATRVWIQIRCESNELVLTVQDNGTGFPQQPLDREGSHGLMGIRERALMLGGHLEVGNPPAGGARISVRLPLSPDATRIASPMAGTAGVD